MFVFRSVHVSPLHFIQRFGSLGKLSLNCSSYKEIFSYGELLASLPAHYGGLDGRVIYIDVESKFSSRRMIEIGARSFPEIFHLKGMAQEMAGRILVLRPTSLSEFTKRKPRMLQLGTMIRSDLVRFLLFSAVFDLV
ncbi:hypothetical protein Q3G72_021975 [Acer saccharum]|nr:hypothetical protein Q3G72_021975 [Acer saccharum]